MNGIPENVPVTAHWKEVIMAIKVNEGRNERTPTSITKSGAPADRHQICQHADPGQQRRLCDAAAPGIHRGWCPPEPRKL